MKAMEHISQAQAIDAARNLLDPAERRAIQQHAASCPSCANALDTWERFAAFAADDEQYEPPADALRVARSYLAADRFLQPAEASPAWSTPALAFDTMAAALAGVRSEAQDSRHLLYQATPLAIDLHLQRGTQNKLVLAGQVIDSRTPSRFSATARIALMRRDEELAVIDANECGEFSCSFAPDSDLSLLIEADGMSVRIALDRWPGAGYVH